MSKTLSKSAGKVNPLLTLSKSYSSVEEMVRDALSDNPEFVAAFEQRLRDRQLVNSLAVIRAVAGMSQAELAAKLGCSQSKVSKLESGTDAGVTFGELAAILDATGHRAKVLLLPAGGLVEEVKSHAHAIKQLLDELVALAGTDGVMVSAAAQFMDEAASNLLSFVKKAARNLPPTAEGVRATVEIAAPEPGDRTPTPRPGRAKRPHPVS